MLTLEASAIASALQTAFTTVSTNVQEYITTALLHCVGYL